MSGKLIIWCSQFLQNGIEAVEHDTTFPLIKFERLEHFVVEKVEHIEITKDSELDKLPKLYSTDEMKIKTNEESKFKIIEALKVKLNQADNGLPKIIDIIDIDGVRIKFQNGWGLVRASNTTPVIVTRFEANSLENMQEIQNEVIALVENIMAKEI